MTLVAQSVGNRRMDGVIEQPSLVRAVGIMARGTVGIGNRIILMDFLKERLVGLMAVLAEARNIFIQEMLGSRRPVGIVAIQASRGHWIVPVFRFFYGITQSLVTLYTEFVSGEHKIEFISCGMGVMAFDTFSFCNHLVAAAGICRYYRRMAIITDFIGARCQKPAVGSRMRTVTSGTIPFFQRCMHRSIFEFLGELPVTVQTDLSLSSGLQFELVLSICADKGDCQRKGDDQHGQTEPEFHRGLYPSHCFSTI